MIGEKESAIVVAIKEALPLVNVEAFPDKPDAYSLMHNKGAVLVAYQGRNVLHESGYCLAESELEFVVSFLFRNLRKRDAHQGIYDSLLVAESALKGIAELKKERFVSFENGVWEYAQLYSVNHIG